MAEIEDTSDYANYDALKRITKQGRTRKNQKDKVKKSPMTMANPGDFVYIPPSGNNELGAEGQTGGGRIRRLPLKEPLPKGNFKINPKAKLDTKQVVDKRADTNKKDMSHLDALGKLTAMASRAKKYLNTPAQKRK